MSNEDTVPTNELTFRGIDHVAIAVLDLEIAVNFYCSVLGFELNQRREIRGAATGMISAELSKDGIKFVLCQGTEPSSQVSRLVSECGPGVAHIAFLVNDVPAAMTKLFGQGMKFDTSVIGSAGLSQAFTSRDRNSGLSFELIQRCGNNEFSETSIQKMFDEMEKSDKF